MKKPVIFPVYLPPWAPIRIETPSTIFDIFLNPKSVLKSYLSAFVELCLIQRSKYVSNSKIEVIRWNIVKQSQLSPSTSLEKRKFKQVFIPFPKL